MCLCFCILMFLVTFYVLPESLGRGVLREAQSASRKLSQLNAVEEIWAQILPAGEWRLATPTDLIPRGTTKWRCMADPPVADKKFPPSSHTSTRATTMYPSRTARRRASLEQYQYETLSVLLGLVLTMAFIQMQFQACVLTWSFLSRAVAPRSFPHRAWKSALRTCPRVVRVQKVVTMLVIKMIFFPMVLGFLLDRAVQPALAISDQDRVLFVSQHPHLSAVLLWISGVTHTLFITMNVILLRNILHHDVLVGFIRMRDPHVNQFLPLLVEPLRGIKPVAFSSRAAFSQQLSSPL